MNEQVSPGNFVRQYVLRHLDASLEDVQQEWTRKGHPKSKMPKQCDIYSAGSVVKKKYELDSFDDVPRKASSNVNELLRLMLKKAPGPIREASTVLPPLGRLRFQCCPLHQDHEEVEECPVTESGSCEYRRGIARRQPERKPSGTTRRQVRSETGMQKRQDR